MIKKIKVVWICHFVNSEIQKCLPLKKNSSEMAPWISILLEELRLVNEIDLHVISPFRWLKKDYSFSKEGINYYFIKTGMPLFHRHWPRFLKVDLWSNYFINKYKIKKLVNKISPDIINLHGVENAYYSSSIFALKKYPVLITIQGLHSLSKYRQSNVLLNSLIRNELKILKEFKYYGIRVKYLEEYIRSINPKAKFHWFKYPFITSNKLDNISFNKIYDCIFFARITKDKGIEDLIRAMALVKDKLPSVTLQIVGDCEEKYKKHLLEMINNYDLNSTIIFRGFVKDRKELHMLVALSKVTVLPTYNDILPGTIIESLKIGTPTIAYAANGVVDFNSEEEIIKLVVIGDVNNLAQQIINLLTNHHLRILLGVKGKIYADKYFNNKEELKKMIIAYKQIINESTV